MQQKRKVSFVDVCNNGETEQTTEESIQVNVRLILILDFVSIWKLIEEEIIKITSVSEKLTNLAQNDE